MKRIILLLATFFVVIHFSMAQQLTITGVVTAQEDGLPIIGASVVEKGTGNGTITNFDGEYSITVNTGAVLEFSYVGMEKQTRTVTTAGKIDIILKSAAIAIEEVVVTAMGVKTEKKKLNFAVQSVDSESLNDSRSANFVNALQGKIAGVNVTNAGGSPNAGSSVILRGISSVNSSQSNQPIYIMDGIAISGGTADINPSDIESVTVLKGAAAAALYGQDAANGVIMITTKQGTVGKLTVNANVSWQADQAVRLPKTQQIYGPGSLGFYRPQEIGGYGGWGAPLPEGTAIYDNIKNFFQTGYYQKYDVNLSGGSEKFQSYTSVGFSKHEGIVVNDYLNKLNILFKANYKITDKLTANASLNIVNNKYRGAGSFSSIYSWPINDDITNYQNEDGSVHFRYIPEGEKEVKKNAPISPLWSRYKDWGENRSTRNIFQASLIYEPVKKLQFTARVSLDNNNYTYEGYTVPRFNILTEDVLPDFSSVYEEGSPEYLAEWNAYYDYYNSVMKLNQHDLKDIRAKNETRELLGSYSYNTSKSQLLTITGLANYSLDLPAELTLDFILGSEIKMREGISSTMKGREFTIPGIYSMQVTSTDELSRDISLTHSQRRNAGVFGEIRLDYKGLANLSATYRADWSSTIYSKYNPYTYPSITAGLIFSELFDLANNWFSYGKLRGNWARVGKDAPIYQFDRRYSSSIYATLPDGGYGINPSYSVAAYDLKPEISDSWEIGLDLRFFDNKTRLDLAYYNTTVDNQIVTVRVSPASGYILQTRNEGNISNKGVEATFEQDIIKSKNMTWTAGLNFGLNRGKVLSLPDDIVEIEGTQYSGIYPTSYLHGSTTAISGKDYLRTDDGQIIIDENGYPKINPTKSVVIGNREPDFLLGLTSNINYRGLSLSFLVDGRKGGDVVNITSKGMIGNGQHKMMETYRGRQVVWEGVVEQADGSYLPNTTPIVFDYKTITDSYYTVGSNFIEDGSYIRLSYITLGYDFSNFFKKNFLLKSLRASFTGRNLFLLTKYTGSDPQINANTSSGGMGGNGIDNYAVPNTRSFNFTLSATF